ncbi:MAG: DoxX family protein [Bacteroidota bacterium]
MKRLRSLLFGTSDVATDLGLLVLRVGIGLAMAFAHGLGKIPPSEGFINATANLGFPLPELFAWAAALAEFGGGLLIAVGLLTRPAAAALAFTMAVAFFGAHGGDPFGERELAFVFGIASVALMISGAGRLSLDRLLAPPSSRRGTEAE